MLLRSFVQDGDRTHDLPEAPDLVGRRPLLAYGANASPLVLAQKLAPLPRQPLPVRRAALADFDVVYSGPTSLPTAPTRPPSRRRR
ncbi:MAG TPA: hypothetical protein VGI73_10050 [Solirubrobacterales bacterium]